jgi:hypothetical protein
MGFCNSNSGAETFAMALFGREPHVTRIGTSTQGVFSDVLVLGFKRLLLLLIACNWLGQLISTCLAPFLGQHARCSPRLPRDAVVYAKQGHPLNRGLRRATDKCP